MSKARLISGYVITFAIGWGLQYLFPITLIPRYNPDWIDVSFSGRGKGISYCDQVIFKSDLPLPGFRNVAGAAKFLNTGAGRSSFTQLGYKISIDVSPLDSSKIPEKYLKPKKLSIQGQTLIRQPSTDAIYEIVIEFELQDKDGFVLKELQSEPQNIESGRLCSLQGFASDSIPIWIASKTDKIFLNISVQKCISYEDD